MFWNLKSSDSNSVCTSYLGFGDTGPFFLIYLHIICRSTVSFEITILSSEIYIYIFTFVSYGLDWYDSKLQDLEKVVMHRYIDIGITNCSLFFPHLTHFQYPSMIHIDPCLFDMLVLCCFFVQLVELLQCYGNHYRSMACYICVVDIHKSCTYMTMGTPEYGVCILGYTSSVLNNSFIHIHLICYLFFFFLSKKRNQPTEIDTSQNRT